MLLKLVGGGNYIQNVHLSFQPSVMWDRGCQSVCQTARARLRLFSQCPIALDVHLSFVLQDRVSWMVSGLVSGWRGGGMRKYSR